MNRDTLCKIFLFAAGAAIGSVATWKLVKTKYEQIAQEEIDSVKDEYASLMKSMRDKLKNSVAQPDESTEAEERDDDYPDDDDRDFTPHEQEMVEYYKLTSKYRKTDDEKVSEEDNENNEEGGNGDEDENDLGFPYINGPYVISADDFNSSPPGYNAQPLDYFADGVLADGWGVVLDIEETIGEDSLEHFGDDQDDILYVRNERNEIDYEVTRDPRTYDEARRTNPNPYYGLNEN